ncbi:MAG: STAS-like domain-containing protein [Bacillota bacterium]
MTIELRKFGTTLTSRQNGKEALAAFSPILKEIKEGEIIYIDFTGVNTFTPSWGDEFLSQLLYIYKDRLILLKTDNPSVKTTISILEETNNIKFSVE